MLLFLTGGPGQPGLPAIAKLPARLGSILDGYRLVVVDQRGTGGTAISCPELQQQVGTSDIAVPSAAAVRICAGSLGKRRAFYSTRDTVADLDALRQALGAKTWTIDGVSYGTFVAERYAIAHPSAVKALVLDSVVPHVDPAGDIPLYLADLQAVGRVLRLACSETHCAFDPAADIAWLVRHGVDGVKLFDTIVEYEFYDPDYKGLMSTVHAARQGNRAALAGLEEQVHQRERRADAALQRRPARRDALHRPALPLGLRDLDREAAAAAGEERGAAGQERHLAVHDRDRRP